MPILDYVDKKVLTLSVDVTVKRALSLLSETKHPYFILRDSVNFYFAKKSQVETLFSDHSDEVLLQHIIDFGSLKLLKVVQANTSVYKLQKNGMYMVHDGKGKYYFFYNKVRGEKKKSAPRPKPKPRTVPPAPLPIHPPRGMDITEEAMEEVEAEAPAFEAYPSISHPGEITPEEQFTVYIGFSKELDETLEQVSKVVIPNPKENDFIQVSLMAIGAAVDNNRLKPLFLDIDAQVAFECTAGTGVKEITLIATYFHQMQPVGTATRKIQLDEQKKKLVPEVETVSKGCSLNLNYLKYDNALLDMTITITRDVVGKQLLWKIVAPQPAIDESYSIKIEDTRSFAKVIGLELGKEGYKDIAANNVLLTLGEQIAAFMPPELFETLAAVHQKIGRKPKVLIWTDEPYVPWELALMEDYTIDSNAPPFLSTQTIIGRWWLSEQVVCPPPCRMEVEELTAIAAEYPFGSKYRPLEEAIEEKKFLIDEFGANEIKASKKKILEMTSQADRSEGHWVHMALHGFSKPDKNEQSLAFEDGELSPMAMIGAYKCGDIPAISFMFLNACQVGTAGSSLGQASGFPGIMLKKGMLGFIAPLWEVHDEQARAFSEEFYTEVLQNGKEIGETLTDLKKAYDYEESLTPLAYIYYGHPAFKVEYEGSL